MDRFDKIRSYIWQHNSACVTGLMWCKEWLTSMDGIIREKGTPSFGHAFVFVGQKTINNEPFLIAQLSNGEGFGDKGKYYFKREIVNEMCTFGNYGLIDLDPEHGKILHQYNLSINWKWLAIIINYFKFFLE